MADRIVTWHISSPGVSLPAYYIEKDYIPTYVRIYAETAPTAKDFEVDIRDDGTTIFADEDSTYSARKEVYSEISYNTLSDAFLTSEVITGGTSGARGRILADKLGNMTLRVLGSTAFTAGETITGGTSATTAVVLSFYHGDTDVLDVKTGVVKNAAVLPKGANLEESADDFPATDTTIAAGSVLTCHVTEMSDAANVTIQLELETAEESDEESD